MSTAALRLMPAAGQFNPLSAITWTVAFWASDPLWANPGNGNAVASWRDGSGNGKDAVQGTGSKQPIFRSAGINGKPAVQGDGIDDFLETPATITQTQPLSMVVIGSFGKSAGSQREQLSAGGSLYRDLAYGSNYGMFAGTAVSTGLAADTSTHLFLSFWSGSSSYGRVDNTQSSTVNPGSGGFSSGYLDLCGNSGSAAYCSPGFLSFSAIYSGDITADSRWAEFKRWVNSYYGLSLS